MSTIMVYVLLIAGFILLIKGADFFVEASSSIARTLRVPSIIIGLTIVAFGTSAPELAVSTAASLAGSNEIAVSNVVGSNVFNLLVVLGACGAIRTMRVVLRWDFAASVIGAVVLLGLVFADGEVGRMDGAILLVLFLLFVLATVRDALVNRVTAQEEYEVLSPVKCLVYIVGGLAAIVWGGDLVVDSATKIAASFGLSQTLIGLTIVAMGTSLPELVTSVVASRKGENGLALGNVIGSNIFNVLMVLGLSASVSPIPVNPFTMVDIGCLIGFSLLVLALCYRKREIGRVQGVVMLAVYAAYMVYICIR